MLIQPCCRAGCLVASNFKRICKRDITAFLNCSTLCQTKSKPRLGYPVSGSLRTFLPFCGCHKWCRVLRGGAGGCWQGLLAAQKRLRGRGCCWCEQPGREGCEGCWRPLRTNPRVHRKLGRKEAPDWPTLQPASCPRRGAQRVPRELKTSSKKALEEHKVEAKTETFDLLASKGLMVELEGLVSSF